MHFVISHTPDSKHYYVEQIEEDLYVGYLITDYVAGMNSFRNYNENIKIEIDTSKDVRVMIKGERRFEWMIVGRVVSMKDSTIKLII